MRTYSISPEVRERIAELAKAGLTSIEIAEADGVECSPRYVENYLNRTGLRAQYPTAEAQRIAARRVRIVELHREGLTNAEIGERLQCHRQTVRKILQAAGLHTPDPKMQAAQAKNSERAAREKALRAAGFLPKRSKGPSPLPVIESDWIRPPTLAQLMARR